MINATLLCIDFKGATRLFADPNFNGDPVQVYEPKVGDSLVPPDDKRIKVSTTGGKYTVSNVEVAIKTERVQYYDKNGSLITESIKDYTRQIIHKEFADFVHRWQSAESKGAVIEELLDKGIILDALIKEVGDYDPFDLISHVGFDKVVVDRRLRVERVREGNYFSKYSDKAKAVLNALLDKYVDEGVESIENINVLKVKPISDFSTPLEVVKLFGSKQKYQAALRELKAAIYFDPPQPPFNKGGL